MILTVLKDHSSPTEDRAKGRAAESTGRPPPLVWLRGCWLGCGGREREESGECVLRAQH